MKCFSILPTEMVSATRNSFTIFMIVVIAILPMIVYLEWSFDYEYFPRVHSKLNHPYDSRLGKDSHSRANIQEYEVIRSANYSSIVSLTKKIILIHSTLFGRKEWYSLRTNDLPNILNRQGCKYNDCMVTYDKNLFENSSVVLFHGGDIDANDLRHMSQNSRPNWQRWVYFTSESPINCYASPLLNGLFNWTMTYKSDSDIWTPYNIYRELGPNEQRPDPRKNFAEGKDKFAAWMASHCGELRDQVIRKLQSLVHVEVGGGCAHKYKYTFECPRGNGCTKILRRYKFYLAFENSFCKEYVTEKYWVRAIGNEVVPVVLGGGPYNDPKVAIPGSYINVANFDNITHLANYLKYLAANDTAYNEYFAWKQKYVKVPNSKYIWPFSSYWPCKACELLHKGRERKIYDQLSDFWGKQIDCSNRDRKIREMLNRS